MGCLESQQSRPSAFTGSDDVPMPKRSREVVKYGTQQKAAQPTAEEQARARFLLSAVLVHQCGFEFGTEQNKRDAMTKLMATSPGGMTALRDAVALGILRLLKLKAVLAQIGGLENRQFVNIVLTDGEDTSSKVERSEMMQLVAHLNKELGSICKTFIVLSMRVRGDHFHTGLLRE